MEITVNGESRSVPADATAATLLELLDLGAQRVAVEINGDIVTRSRYDQHRLAGGDRVEIVRAVGGG